MNPARIAAICLLAIVATCGVCGAQDQGPWWTWSTIDGNWGGYRQYLADRGIVLSGTTLVDLLGNVSGGNRRAFAPADGSLVAADIDLAKLASLGGLLFHVEFVANAGENLSSKSIGNVLQVATAFAPEGYYLGQMYAQQKFFDDRLTIQLGRMTTANNFGSLPIFNDYVSFGINPLPFSLTDNTLYFTSLPAVEWAGVGTMTLNQSISLAAGIYETNFDSGLPLPSQHGVDFSFDGSGGPMELVQFTYSRNRGPNDMGLPGTYYLGGYYSGADYQELSGEAVKRGNYGFYFEAQQMVYRSGGSGSDTGLTPWFGVTYSPEQKTNRLPVLVIAGAVYHGLIPGRSDDSLACGFYYGKLSNSLPAAAGEKVVEIDYTFWLTPWLGITPDFQYVLSPGGASTSKNAAVLGTQFQVQF